MSATDKPVLRLVHQLARTGGTLLNRCLGTMDRVLMLSEVHPRQDPDRALRQAVDWFGLTTVADEVGPPTPGQSGAERLAGIISAVVRHAENAERIVVLRDWTHIDFVGVPFNTNPGFRLSTAEALNRHFTLRQVCIVRHPLDQYLSSLKRPGMAPHLRVGPFLEGCRRFAGQALSIGAVRYEDIIADPAARIAGICRRMDLPFDPTFIDRWHTYDKVTGDTKPEASRGLGRREILRLPRRDCPPEMEKAFLDDPVYHTVLEHLGYTHAL